MAATKTEGELFTYLVDLSIKLNFKLVSNHTPNFIINVTQPYENVSEYIKFINLCNMFDMHPEPYTIHISKSDNIKRLEQIDKDASDKATQIILDVLQIESIKFGSILNTESESEPDADSEPKVESKTELQVEPKAEAIVEPKPEVKVEPKPELKVEPKPEVKVEPKPELKVEPKAKPEVKIEPKAKPDIKSKVVSKVEPKLKSDKFKNDKYSEIEIFYIDDEDKYHFIIKNDSFLFNTECKKSDVVYSWDETKLSLRIASNNIEEFKLMRALLVNIINAATQNKTFIIKSATLDVGTKFIREFNERGVTDKEDGTVWYFSNFIKDWAKSNIKLYIKEELGQIIIIADTEEKLTEKSDLIKEFVKIYKE